MYKHVDYCIRNCIIMLRKRTVIKPNLGQAATEPPKPVTIPLAAETNTRTEQLEIPSTAADNSCKQQPDEPDLELSRRVNAAINQLTAQKLEPIKSINLKNKNVKLKDLMFLNPPLTKDQKKHRKEIHKARKSETATAPSEPCSEEHSLVPKVKLGPEGKLILDESSTVIKRNNQIKEQVAIIEDNEEVISRTGYNSFRRRSATSSEKWSTDETQKFYQALTLLGPDFSMIESLVFCGNRSRSELHRKFKREERTNKAKIDVALSHRISVSSEELDNLKDILRG